MDMNIGKGTGIYEVCMDMDIGEGMGIYEVFGNL
jgi:hypothetical protein